MAGKPKRKARVLASIAGGPGTGREGQSARVPSASAGVLHSGDDLHEPILPARNIPTGSPRERPPKPPPVLRKPLPISGIIDPPTTLSFDRDPYQSPEDPLFSPDAPPLAPIVPAPKPVSDDNLAITHYKGTALKNIGRDASGRVVPHKRSELTARKVADWVLGGYTKNDIAVKLNIRPGLVEECYGAELRHGQEMVGMDITGHILKRAKKSDRMAIFVAKSRMGWKDGDNKDPDTSPLMIHIHA